MARTTRKAIWTVHEAEKALAKIEAGIAWAEDYIIRMKAEVERRKKELEEMKKPGWQPRKLEYPTYRYGM